MRTNKKAQFFILSAVVIASIIAGFAVIRNSLTIQDTPRNFYSYGYQIKQETRQVIDFSIYNNNKNILEDFFEKLAESTKTNRPQLELYSCYTTPLSASNITCRNDGKTEIFIQKNAQNIQLNPNQKTSFSIEDAKNITLIISKKWYTINLDNLTTTFVQAHFILRTASSSGEYVYSSEN